MCFEATMTRFNETCIASLTVLICKIILYCEACLKYKYIFDRREITMGIRNSTKCEFKSNIVDILFFMHTIVVCQPCNSATRCVRTTIFKLATHFPAPAHRIALT